LRRLRAFEARKAKQLAFRSLRELLLTPQGEKARACFASVMCMTSTKRLTRKRVGSIFTLKKKIRLSGNTTVEP
ncbi:hypothetical protein, partial [Mesorhizobium sp.]|uniref:hypothetical protein n=1 Tax=Mesorhizobium sp. TaxID=1871066 RepID=UPI0025CE824C